MMYLSDRKRKGEYIPGNLVEYIQQKQRDKRNIFNGDYSLTLCFMQRETVHLMPTHIWHIRKP